MDEILELQQQLAAAQQGSKTQKLSERNCVELVMKLQALKLIDLIFTKSGREYLTHKQLVIEIEDEIVARGGRLNVIDLPEVLSVDLVHIQSKLPGIVSASDGATRLVRGEILTDYYLANVAEQINDALTASEHGVDNIGSIASRYALPIDIVREVLSTHQGTLVNASLDSQNPDILRSEASIARDRAAARGLLRAVTAPTPLSDLSRLRGLPLALVATLAEEMLEDGSLSGSRVGRGARAVFVPAVFSRAAAEAARSAFASNGFVTKDRLSKMHVGDIGGLVYEHLKDAVVFDACLVDRTLLETLSTSAVEAVSGSSWLDVDVSLPPDFPREDVQSVMARLLGALGEDTEDKAAKSGETSQPAKSSRSRKKASKSSSVTNTVATEKQASALLYGQRYVVSPSLIEMLRGILEADAVQKAKERARLITERMSTVVTQATSAGPAETLAPPPSEGGKKSKGKGRRRAGGKEKSGKGREANGANNTTSTLESDFPISTLSADEAIELVLGEGAWSSVVETDYLGASTAGDEMTACVVEEIYGDNGLASLYQVKAEEAIADLVRERVEAKKDAEKAVLTGLENAELYGRSARTLPEEELVSASRAWIMSDMCSGVLCRSLDLVAQSNGVIEASIIHAHKLKSKKERLEVVRNILPKLAPVLETKIRPMLDVVAAKNGDAVEDFLTAYDENAEVLDLPTRRPLDKKREKAAFANARAQLVLSLEPEDGVTEEQCLRSAAVLVHSKSCGGSIVSFSPESTREYCAAIEENARPAEAGAALKDLREALSSESGAAELNSPSESLSPQFAEKLTALREHTG